MAKRNSDGDVLFNRMNVGLAKKQRLLASLLGPKIEPESTNGKLEQEKEREDLEDEVVAPEQVGIGGKIPQNIKDGSFTQRTFTSNDRLLETLIGKKAAKAHIAKKQPTKNNPTPINFDKPFNKPSKKPKPVVSEDEDEGRTAAFRSKKKKTSKQKPVVADPEALEVEANAQETELPRLPVSAEGDQEDGHVDHETTKASMKDPDEDDSGAENFRSEKSTKRNSTTRSYLDEILAERSKKKKKKKRNQETAAS